MQNFLAKKKIKTFLIIILIFVFANIFIWTSVYRESQPRMLTVSFLDVGQGDSIFIKAPNGNEMLVDAGRNAQVLRDLSKVTPFFDRSIDVVVATHPHADHVAGFIDVLKKYHIGLALVSGQKSRATFYQVFHNALKKNNVKTIKGKRGMIINLGSGVYFDIVSPEKLTPGESTNETSIVGKLTYGNTSFLLTGDAPIDVEKKLIARYGDRLKSDVLKAGHHGSKNSSSIFFLQTVGPSYTVISAGIKNRYGLPDKSVIKHIKTVGSKVVRTETDARMNNVTFKSNGENIFLLQ
jgi:competence protein ComEC